MTAVKIALKEIHKIVDKRWVIKGNKAAKQAIDMLGITTTKLPYQKN